MYFANHLRFAVLLLGALWSASALADPPARVARLGYAAGAVSFSAAGENEWVQARLNRPLARGDRLWTDADGRAEVQAGGAMVRMGADTSLTLINLDDRIAQLQLTQGTLHVTVRYLERSQVVEVNTPQLAFTLRRPGRYRISVNPEGDATDIVVRKGQGEAYGTGSAYLVDARQPYRFRGTGLRDYQYLNAPVPDAFERWAGQRDRRLNNSKSARYVSRDVVGYQDLDANGSWRNDPAHGNVWIPNRMPTGWTPYRDGHWAWIDPWGWSWVDDAPWGYAVSHYGRWANMGGTWGWVPGPVRAPAVYAPAQVAFVGGDNFRLNVASALVGAVAWFALAPREVYSPPYQASREYMDRINRSNTVINNTTVTNTTTNVTNINTVVYANQSIPGAVVAVPATVFVQSQPVARASVPVSREQLANQPVSDRAAVVPIQRSVHGAAGAASKPSTRALEREVVARTAPPPAHVGFAAQLAQLAQQPGKPLDEATRNALKPASTAPVPIVKVVTVAPVAPPVVPPPAPARPAASAPVAVVAAPASAPVAGPVPLPARPDPARGPGQAAKPETPTRPAPTPALPAAPPTAGASATVLPKAPLMGSVPAPNAAARSAAPVLAISAPAPTPAPAPARASAPAPAPAPAPTPARASAPAPAPAPMRESAPAPAPAPARASAPAPTPTRASAPAPAPAAARESAPVPAPAPARAPAPAPAPARASAPAPAPAPAAVRTPAPVPVAVPAAAPPAVTQRPVDPKASVPAAAIAAAPVSAPAVAAPPKKDPPTNQRAPAQAPPAAASAAAASAAVVAAKPVGRSSRARPADSKEDEERLREEEKRKPKG